MNDSSKLVATLKLKAPEVIQHEGRWFISDLGSFQALKLRRLRWDSQETDSRSNANPIQPGAPSRP